MHDIKALTGEAAHHVHVNKKSVATSCSRFDSQKRAGT